MKKNKKKKYINNKRERAILSDVLPYEIPIIFSNRYFYEFLIENEIQKNGKEITWKSQDESLEEIVKLLFDIDGFANNDKDKTISKFEGFAEKTIPFGFKILHKENGFRELSVIHPKGQLALVEFYDKYKQLILYYCNISSFSLRRPHKIAKFTYYKDRMHFKNYAHDHEHKLIEEFDKEYENLKTFFAYKEMSNIHKFYESYKYHRCEKKYNYLFKFDVSKCFDSIYTHSISWALFGKNIVKDNLEKCGNTFGDKFDKFMQNTNYGETNGILIGPEFSRLFAELILQKIDNNVKGILQTNRPALKYRQDYEVFRYVDDVFVFYNDEKTKDAILTAYRLQLKEFKLSINDSKTEYFVKPIITGITIAKLKISDLFNKNLDFKIEKKEENPDKNKFSLYVSSNKLITRFKKIIKEANVEYKDILTYSLACIDRKIDQIVENYLKDEEKAEHEKEIVSGILEIIDFSFFLYSISPKVNATIKLSMALTKLTKFVKSKKNGFDLDNQGLVLKKIYDEIFLVLKKQKNIEHIQIETLYLLIQLKELGREYLITEDVLCRYYEIDLKEKKCKHNLNYFSIVVLLYYIGNKNRYQNAKSIIEKEIIEKISKINKIRRKKTAELVLLFFDLIVCPYLKIDFKNKLFDLYSVSEDSELRSGIIAKRKYWFTKWADLSLINELEAKRGTEVY